MNPQYIKINMVPNGVVPVLYCSQYDVGRPLGMVVYNGSETVDLDDFTVIIEATRTDGTAITAAITTDGNVCALETTATMTNKADRYPAQIVVADGNGNRIASIPVTMMVVKAAMDENAEGVEEDRSLYQQYTGTVQSLIADIRTQLNAETAARQAAVSAEASARQAADNQLQSNINAEASARATQDNVLQAEIDQLLAPSGSAPSAAEVENARVGADGTTYPTLGDAIRTQVTDVKSQIGVCAEFVGDALQVKGRGKWTDNSGTVTFVAGASGTYACAMEPVPVTGGDVVHVTLKTSSGKAVIFAAETATDGEYTLIDAYTYDNSTNIDRDYTVPTGATHVLLNKYATGVSYYCKILVQKTDKMLTVENVPADGKATGEAIANIAIQKEVDTSTDVTVINYYMAVADGTIKSTNTAEVHTLYFKCIKNTLYRFDHPLSGRFVVGCFTSIPALNSVPTSFVVGTSADQNEDTTFIRTEGDTEYLAAYYYTETHEIDDPQNTFNAIHIYSVPVDNTLTQAGVPADAEATGEAIASVASDLRNLENSTNDYYSFFVADDDTSLVDTFSGVIALYDALVTDYGDYISKNALTKDGLTLYEYVLTTGNYNAKNGQRAKDAIITKPTILVTSGVHGYERSSVMSLYRLCKYLCENKYSLADVIDYVTFRVIPIVCPSGYDANSRTNSNGVNINRNFASTSWTQTSEGDNYSGAAPGDQTETQIVQDWLGNHTDAFAYIDWHNSNYTSEVSCLLGTTEADSMTFKKRYLLGINKIIPYWQKKRGIDDANIYAYSGHTSTGGTAKSYGDDLGIMSFTFETSWNIDANGKDSAFSIGTGVEAMGNTLIGLKDYYKDI